MKPARTRFAPSPTGFLHVGGVRTALFAWLVARQSDGQFILRIEDTDRSRHVEESEKHITESLRWLGLEWDEGPFRQSERLDVYKQWGQKLIDAGRAYADTRSPEELDKIRGEFTDQKKPVLFRERRPENPPSWQPGMSLRFKSEPKSYTWRDAVMGELSTGPEVVDDFIILKSDGFPTYNFAHIVDDAEMKISHVIRSQEFLASVPKFLNLYEALGIEVPTLATLPYVVGPDGRKKLSKRDGAKDVLAYARQGYLPEALVNFMASLGWNDGTEQEIFSIDELVEKFSLDRVHHGGARFDEQRLLWMNGHYIRELPLDKLFEKSQDFWPKEAESADEAYKKKILALVQERLKFLAELPELTDFFFKVPDLDKVANLYTSPVDKQLKNSLPEEEKRLLQAGIEVLEQSNFSEENIKQQLNKLLEQLGIKPGVLFPILRIAVSGKPVTPELFGTLSVLGKNRAIPRLEQAARALEK